jgi:hypothetical protein
MLHWIQKSGTVHSIKELEKALPSVGSINGMQVKEYVQAMLDENEIRVEKIGIGNWYWSFPSEDALRKEETLGRVQAECERAIAGVKELTKLLKEAEKERAEDDDMMVDGEGTGRKELLNKNEQLKHQTEVLQTELSSYSENDPVEVDRQKERIAVLQKDAEKYSDQIQDMESWIRSNMGADRNTMLEMQRAWYGDQFDEEQQSLREI